jgi:colicin import membrane protein
MLHQVPLTADDVLHPQVEDFIMHTTAHDDDCDYLRDVFKARAAGKPGAVVLHDCRVDFNVPGVRPLGPDITVFFDVRRVKTWSTFYVAKEGVKPVLVTEVSATAIRNNDLGIKIDFYHRAQVGYYIIVDREGEMDGPVLLIGRRYRPDGYELMPLDDRGRLWLEPLGVRLGVENDRVVCYDGATDEKIEGYVGQVQARAAEGQARVAAEVQAVAAVQARAAAEVLAAAAVQARVAAAEAQARAVAEARLRQVEEEMRRLRGDPRGSGEEGASDRRS